MADQTKPGPLTTLQRLAAMFGGSQAGANVQAAQNPGYTLYVREAQANGETPLTIEQWMQQQLAPPQQAQAAPQPSQQAPAQPFRF